MSGQALSAYCGFLNQYYELLATGQFDKSDALAMEMDVWWGKLTEVERDTARRHVEQLAERYAT